MSHAKPDEKDQRRSLWEQFQSTDRRDTNEELEPLSRRSSNDNQQGLPEPDSFPDVPSSFGRCRSELFTHGNPNALPDSWIKVAADRYRRTYDWLQFCASDFASWTHVELTEPLPFSISQEEADRREAEARIRPPRNEMGG